MCMVALPTTQREICADSAFLWNNLIYEKRGRVGKAPLIPGSIAYVQYIR